MDPGDETARTSAYASWSWTRLCFFISGIFFGSFVSGLLLRWKKPLLSTNFRVLLGYQDSNSDNIQDEALGGEDSASLHSLDSNISQGSSLSQQEDSAWDHPSRESKSIITEGSNKYDVFLSFIGEDTRRSFIDYLYHRLSEEGISAFGNEVELNRGETISSQLLQAIKDSRIYIVVFSRSYASSTWCLDELVAIVDCYKEMKQELFPVFYDVDPYEVGCRSGAYQDAFDLHRERFKEEPDKIYKWKGAMSYLANLNGLTLDQEKGEGIEKIVEKVSGILVYKFQKIRFGDKHPESTERRPSLKEVNKYDVFLSLRHTHTHSTFIYYLYHYLTKKGFSTFKSAEIQEGESIPSEVLQAIKDSRIIIVVFTRDYADSTCSLEEMTTIVECHRELEQTIIPVFFDVDPKDFRTEIGPYKEAFVSHTEKFKQDPLKSQKWKEALTHVSNINGVHIKHESEIQVIGKIVQTVELRLRLTNHNLEKLLNFEDNRVLVFGIWGMGGSGKTTHALALYKKIFQQFEAACFIKDLSQVYGIGGATAVEKEILRQTLNEELRDVYSPFEISGLVRKRLSWKRILIVFDNVDELMQLKELAINRLMLGMGSRIIITTRNRRILDAYEVDEIYEIPLLNEDEARELFLSACPGVTNYDYYTELIPRVLEYAGGLPLAIKELASILQVRREFFFQDREKLFWEHTLNRLRTRPIVEITKPLQTSFESLDEDEKEIFLHIACFFHGKRGDYVIQVLNSCGFFAEIGIQALLDKSLITIQNEEIHMHDLLQDLGKKIVREECAENPELRSRLWLYEDFSIALRSTTENKVKAIVLYEGTSTSKHEYLNIERLSKMRNLVLLILYGQHFSGIPTSLPHRLRYLSWDGYPFSFLLSFEPYNRLVELNLPNSRIKQLWNGRKNFPRLERVDMSYSEELTETPNFEGCPSLKRLDLTGCTNLGQVHPSIRHLKELAYLSFRDCGKLVTLNLKNTDFTGLPNLEHIDLGECTSLSTVDDSLGLLQELYPLQMAQMVVLKVLTMTDKKTMNKAMEAVSGIFGVEAISADIKEQKLTVIGQMPTVAIVKKLKKVGKVDIISVGPVKEVKKEEKKEEKERGEEEKGREGGGKKLPLYTVADLENKIWGGGGYGLHLR